MDYKATVTGMTCKSCERKVEEALFSHDSITFVRAYASRDYAIISSSKEVKPYQVNKLIKDLGYSCDTVVEHTPRAYDNVLNVLLIVAVISLLVLGRRFVPTLDSADGVYIGLSVVFVYGLLNSFHCMSMCGGLIVSRIMIVHKTNKKKEISFFIFGRVLSYTLIGAFLGGLGSLISINETFKGFVSLFAGVLMLLLALQLLGYIRLPRFKRKSKSKTYKSSFSLGVMNGFLPCGSLQAMQLFALSTGSVIYGGAVMLVFSLTTSLSLATLATLTSKIRMHDKKIKILSVVIIMFLGVQFVTQGVSQIDISSADRLELLDIYEIDEYQELTMNVTNTYTFDKTEIKAGIPVKIQFGEVDPDGCSNPFYIISPSGKRVKVDVIKDASPIVFLPEETGELRIVCWMNMRSASLSVVE